MIQRGLSFAEYEAILAMNHSWLKNYDRSPAHALHYQTAEKRDTDALRLGGAFHAAVLEPISFSVDYVVPPKVDRRTKIGKATYSQFVRDNTHKTFLKADEHALCLDMQRSVRQHPVAGPLLSCDGDNEITVTGELCGVVCKGRIDRDVPEIHIDIKTTRDASLRAFGRSAFQYVYHSQAAFYTDLYGENKRFVLVAVEKYAPFAVACYEVGEDELEIGRRFYQRLLTLHKQCIEQDEWPGYYKGINLLQLPDWAYEETKFKKF